MKGESNMHLHLVSTNSKIQAGKGIACEKQCVQERASERRAPERCEQQIDERAARVDALRDQVRAGTYQIDSHALAERLLRKQVDFI